MAVYYKWVVETVREYADDGGNDIIDTCGQVSYAEAVKVASEPCEGADCHFEIVLVRDDDDRRSWAYMEDGKLQEYAEDAYGTNWGKIPKKYHVEVAKFSESQSCK